MKELVREAIEDRENGLAAEVAFFSVLSVFPGLLLVASALGWLDSVLGNDLARRSQAAVLDFLQRVLTDQASGAIDAVRSLFTQRSGGILATATLVALWSLARGFASVTRALNEAYDIDERRPWVRVRLIGLGWPWAACS